VKVTKIVIIRKKSQSQSPAGLSLAFHFTARGMKSEFGEIEIDERRRNFSICALCLPL
jgi:hypothetical protein